MQGAGGGRRQEHSSEEEDLQNSSRRPSDADDEESVSTMMSETPPQLSHRDPGDMLEVYADGDFEDGEEEEEEEEEEDTLELVVETLTGDSYRVRISQWDTAASLKELLYRTQGIHPSHQHLILRDRELVDDACLIDQQVVDGSTLRLVLAIHGGPINARRLPTHDDLLLRDFTFDDNRWRNEGGEKSPQGGSGQTFTFIVFHDDENGNLNFYRVIENPDGSYSPLNESSSSGTNGRVGDEEASALKTQLTEEEKRTMARMADLRVEMDKLRLRSKKKDKRKAVVSSTHTSLNSSLKSVPGRLEEVLTPRLDLTEISGLAGGGTAHTTPRKRSPVKRLATVRRGSRPTTQERMELMKSSHGRPTLRELPTANPPVPVDFSRRKPLEAIRPQLIGGRLEAVEEMLGRGESSAEHGGRVATGRQQEAWPSRDAPNPPLYMLPEVVSSGKHKRYDRDRLNHSHNQELLRPVRHTAGRRPKTSPEVLERRPGTLPDALGERIMLRDTDDRLRELCSILEPSRGDSRQSKLQGSPLAGTGLPPLSLSHSFTGIGPPPRTHRSNSVSVSLASLRTRGATPPSPGQGALVTSGSREQRDALRGLMQSQGGGGASRPNSGRMALPPAVLPPVTPKRRKNRRKPRCEKCSRRLGVSSTYECRCGGLFCAQHRYSETHTCSFDYRTAGRAMLALANPLVAPNRVPKI
ncbi:AN1-type zinc finger protein 4-like isoform X2 [Portunus trituberculatus]|uniref:AN1-type zinc finger protein 4-like isoform X2 n=1 Tax=Portunus trituberculatus TaxID=210409 RepID=UPI001E1CCC04|nr:AN1-type zinc finger protein 4-like isoform X2 [Portunus trituberculatus]